MLNELEENLRSLSAWKQVAFMAYCCERMLPSFRQFSQDTGYGDIAVLRNALDGTWDWIVAKLPVVRLSELRKSCECQAPETSEFSSIYTSAALDVTTAIAITLDSIEEFHSNNSVEVAKLARDSVDLFVQESSQLDPNSAEFEKLIESHPAMQAEIRIQFSSVQRLSELSEDRQLEGRRLRSLWSNLEAGLLEGSEHESHL